VAGLSAGFLLFEVIHDRRAFWLRVYVVAEPTDRELKELVRGGEAGAHIVVAGFAAILGVVLGILRVARVREPVGTVGAEVVFAHVAVQLVAVRLDVEVAV
jgi:hypothetical protein